jgi:thymidylate synthase
MTSTSKSLKTAKYKEGAAMSKADEIFIENCRRIINEGFSDEALDVRPKWEDGKAAHTIKCFGIVNRYNVAEEFPILTLRRTYLKSAVDELLWIWQKKSNNIKDLHSHVWDAWADENGSIGKAYGYQLGVKHQYPEGEFDQVDRVLYDLKNNPSSRRIMTNIYVHSDLKDMRLYPCAYSVTFNVTGNKLNAVLNQRSQDMLTANNWNVVQYSALLIMMAKTAGLEAGELVHVIADAHIYDRHIPIVEQIIANKPYDAPILLAADKTDFYDFTPDDFKLENYKYHELNVKIPVAV